LVVAVAVLRMAPELAVVLKPAVVVVVDGMLKVQAVQVLQDKVMQAVQRVHLSHMEQVEVELVERVVMLKVVQVDMAV
jgi:hypothetical protein